MGLHVATAVHLGRRCVYTLDPGMRALKEKMGVASSQFLEPLPRRGELFSQEPPETLQ